MPAKHPLPAAPAPTPPFARRGDRAALLSGAILAAGTIAFYSGTFSVPLLLDDSLSIADNPTIRRLWPIWPALHPPLDSVVGGRPLLNLSLAVNYAFGGTSVLGYHWINLTIHVLAAWTLFALVRRTLRQPVLAARFASSATVLALAVSAIWAWHPVLTESVTYLSQRAEALMGLCYLLTLYCFVRGAEAGGRRQSRIWFSLSALACLAGAGTKEVIVTAPLLALLYDRTFISGRFSAAWRRHRGVYLALAASWIPLGFLTASLSQRGVGFAQAPPWWVYGLTECRVVVKYLLLSVWPHPLIFDRGTYAPVPFHAILPYALALAGLLTAAIVALRRAPAAGFAAAWFFLILAPVSSIIPILPEPMAENRLYLPLAGIVSLTVLGAFAFAGRRSLPAFAIVAVALGLASLRRNQDYASATSIWSDTVAKNPNNARARTQLGSAWVPLPGHLNDAVAEYEAALRLDPTLAETHTDLGNIWADIPGRMPDAIAEYETALRLKPSLAETHNDLGIAWSKQPGRINDAIAQYQEALRLRPDYAEAHYDLGSVWLNVPGRLNDAIAQFRMALRLKPDYPEAHSNLGGAWLNIPGRQNDAIAEYREALREKPDFAEAHYNLGSAWADMPGHLNDAIAQYQEALRLRPEVIAIRLNLALALLKTPGRTPEAVAQIEAALRQDPGNEPARQLLAQIRAPSP